MRSRERVNKGTDRMNSLTWSPLVISFAGKTASYKSCVTPYRVNSYPGLSALRKKFLVCKNSTREATLCPNILNALRIFARISKFCCFHEAKQTQKEVRRFFYNLAEFVFEYFCDSRRILATFAKFCLNSLFAT